MAGRTGGATSSSSNAAAPKLKKRVEEPPQTTSSSSYVILLKRAKDGSAFAKCEVCNKYVAVALIAFHTCSLLDAKIKINLEAQVVEIPTVAKKKPAAADKRKAKSMANKAKNPNAPKRPPTAFFLFMEDFRKSFKEDHPDCKSVAMVAKEGGERWKSMIGDDKETYIERAAELKAEYDKALESNESATEQDEGESTEIEDMKSRRRRRRR